MLTDSFNRWKRIKVNRALHGTNFDTARATYRRLARHSKGRLSVRQCVLQWKQMFESWCIIVVCFNCLRTSAWYIYVCTHLPTYQHTYVGICFITSGTILNFWYKKAKTLVNYMLVISGGKLRENRKGHKIFRITMEISQKISDSVKKNRGNLKMWLKMEKITLPFLLSVHSGNRWILLQLYKEVTTKMSRQIRNTAK